MAFTNGSRGCGVPQSVPRAGRTVNFRFLASVALSVSLLAGPTALVSCGGGDPEPEAEPVASKKKRSSSSRKKRSSSSSSRRSSSSSERKSSSRRSSGLEDEVADLLDKARDSGASAAFAAAYRKAKGYYDDARDADDADRAELRLERAKKGLTELISDFEALKEKKAELDKLVKEAEAARKSAEEAGANTLAAEDFDEAVRLMTEASRASADATSPSEIKKAADDYATAADLFADAVSMAEENARKADLAKAELEAMERYKEQAQEQGANVKAITDWAQAERSERQAAADLDAGRFQAAIHSYQQATQGYIRALQNTVSAEQMQALMEKNEARTKEYLEQQRELAEKRIEADKEAELAKAKARQLALEQQKRAQAGPGVVPLGSGGGSFGDAFAAQNLSTAASQLNASLYTHLQQLDPDDEEFLNEHHKKLASTLQYDPATGVAHLDLRSGATMRKDFKDYVESLHRRKYISFINQYIEGSEEAQSFMGNTQGQFLIPVPFKYRVRVEWDMSIQTMDANGTFNTILMYNNTTSRNSHYLTNWVHWQSSTRGSTPKTVKAVPGKFAGSANYWFDKTRDIGMVVEFKAPGEDLGTDQPTEEQVTDTAAMTVIYDTKTDPMENTFTSSGPVTFAGFVGFKWHRVKFTVKRLKISGILDKQEAVDQLRTITGIKKKKSSSRRAPEKKGGAETDFESLGKPQGGGQPDFDF